MEKIDMCDLKTKEEKIGEEWGGAGDRSSFNSLNSLSLPKFREQEISIT